MSSQTREQFLSLSKLVDYPCGLQVARRGDPIDFVYFPESGVSAVLAAIGEQRQLASVLIGREGFVGWPGLMGASEWPSDVVARGGSGRAWRVAADDLRTACRRDPALFMPLLAFVSVVMLQLERSIISSLLHPIDRRLARWLLLYHDRLDGDEIRITHEEIALMLGIRRASATDVMHLLEGDRLVRNQRGLITVRDRAGLERFAGEAYGVAEAEYRRLIGPFGKPTAAASAAAA